MSQTRQVILAVSILILVAGGLLRKPAIWLTGIGGILSAVFMEGI